MDFTSFCAEFYQQLTQRLPRFYLPGPASARGGFYYPSSHDKQALYIDMRDAYQRYLTGIPISIIADALEAEYLHSRQPLPPPLQQVPPTLPPPENLQWAVRFHSPNPAFAPDAEIAGSVWHHYRLIPCFRLPAVTGLDFVPWQGAASREICHAGSPLWQRIYRQLPVQDPPCLYEIRNGTVRPCPGAPLSVPDLAELSRESRYILSGKRGLYGAAALLYPGLPARLHSLLGPLYILLVSPHESLLFPGARTSVLREAEAIYQDRLARSLNSPDRFLPALCQYTVEDGFVFL